jgi:hypothetical protein
MRKRFGSLLSLAAGLAFVPASPAAAAEVTAEQRAAYLACYRSVLRRPEFALMDSAELYRIREEGLARTVVMDCAVEMRPYGKALLEAALRSPDKPEEGATGPKDWLFIHYESGLRRQVADDLVEAAPRVKPIADAEAAKAPAATAQ